MKILADRHHSSLTNSLRLLFKERLGHELYFQFGMSWYPEFWDLQPFEATAKQFLEPNSHPYPDTPSVSNTIGEDNGIFLIESFDGNPPTKGITLERFKQEKFDIIIASVPQHIPLFKKLIALYQPQAKLIFQIGNAWNIPRNSVNNVMASARIDPPPQINYIQYHQEFSTETFHYESAKVGKKVYSFINCLGAVDLYKKDWELFLELEKLMPDWEFKSFGGICRDGAIGKIQDVADKMREATYIYQVKTEGDGYGHNIFGAAAIGRGIITREIDYHGKLADPLIDISTAILVGSPEYIKQKLEETADPSYYGDNIHKKFKENVDFDKEAIAIANFLDRLI